MTSNDKKQGFGRVRRMIRLVKKWWMLDQLRKAIARHSRKADYMDIAQGGSVLLTQWFFIAGRPENPEYPGLARRSLTRFSRIIWWRRNPKEDNLKERVREYNDLFTEAVKDRYIEMVPTSVGEAMPSTATPKAGAFSGWFGLTEKILTEYKLTWTFFVIPLALGAYGLPFVRDVIRRIFERAW